MTYRILPMHLPLKARRDYNMVLVPICMLIAYFTNSRDRFVCVTLYEQTTLEYKQLVYDGSDQTGTVCADMG